MDRPGRRGREADLHRLERALQPPLPRVVVLLGAEGGGTSTVVGALLERELPFRTTAHGATAWGSGAAVLLGLLTGATTADGSALPDATPAVRAVTEALERGELTSTRFPYRAAAAVLELVEQVAARGPVLAVLEDLHRAEPAVLSLVRFLLRRLPGLDLSLLLTARPDVHTGPLARTLQVAAQTGSVVLELPPLPPPVLRSVAEDAIGTPLPAGLAARLPECGGDLVLLHALLTGDAERVAAARLAALSPEAGRLVRTAAVLGPRSPTGVLADAVGLPAFTLEPLLAEALGQRVLREEGDALVFRSGLVREAALAAVPLVLRDRLERECALARERAGPPAAAQDPLHDLTPAQGRVARLAAQGLSNAAIAARLFLSPYTVETHLKQVYARLGLHSRAQLAALVVASAAPAAGSAGAAGATSGAR